MFAANASCMFFGLSTLLLLSLMEPLKALFAPLLAEDYTGFVLHREALFTKTVSHADPSLEVGYLNVDNGLIGEIVVDNQGVLFIVAEEFSHCCSSVGCKELKRHGTKDSWNYNDAVLHGLFVIELSNKLSNGGWLLYDTNVDIGQGIVLGLLVNYGVNSNGDIPV